MKTFMKDYIDGVIESLSEVISRQGIESELTGRAKHIYSIWRKMQRKVLGFHRFMIFVPCAF